MSEDLNEMQRNLATISANVETIKTDLAEFKVSIRELYSGKNEHSILLSGMAQSAENMKERISQLEAHSRNCPLSKVREDINAVGAKVNVLYWVGAMLTTSVVGLVFKLLYDFITQK